MGIEDIADPLTPLLTVTEMWGHVLFWSFLLTTVTYLVVGVVWAVCLRKWSSLLVPLGYLGYAEFTVLTTDAIASAFVAGIYWTSGWTMTTGVALGWGLGLSLFSLLLNSVISCAPLYIFL
ncbi:transmembrane protein 170B-like [Halichondria panicea]|uniref:transmembrane protein 170B-like n=1 Tax=Halichondria panicea TaxID=6063 RepID=UPI00312BBE30